MEKIKITKVFVNDKSKDGKPFKDHKGNPFKKIAIKSVQYPEKWASSLIFREDDPKLGLKEGDEVVVKIWETEDGWLNFDIPSRQDLLEERLLKLEIAVFGEKEVKPEEPKKAEPEIQEEKEPLPF